MFKKGQKGTICYALGSLKMRDLEIRQLISRQKTITQIEESYRQSLQQDIRIGILGTMTNIQHFIVVHLCPVPWCSNGDALYEGYKNQPQFLLRMERFPNLCPTVRGGAV